MSNSPLVSILVPVYNVEPYIERCARSLFGQTYTNLEFIFVDDASTDLSMEILQRIIGEYPKWDGRITVLYHQQNHGLPACRNTLIDHCKGEFLTHVDSDDWVGPNMVELLVKRQQETDADIVTGQAWRHRGEQKYECNSGNHLNREQMLVAYLERTISSSHWRRLFRSSILKDNNIRCIEEFRIHDDLQMMPRIIYFAKNVAWIDDFVYHYNYDNQNSISQKLLIRSDFQEYRDKVLRMVMDFFKDKEEPFRRALEGFVIFEYSRSKHFALETRQHELYNSSVAMLDTVRKDNWCRIGWDKPIKRWLDHHYYINRLSQPFRVWHGKLARKEKTCNNA